MKKTVKYHLADVCKLVKNALSKLPGGKALELNVDVLFREHLGDHSELSLEDFRAVQRAVTDRLAILNDPANAKLGNATQRENHATLKKAFSQAAAQWTTLNPVPPSGTHMGSSARSGFHKAERALPPGAHRIIELDEGGGRHQGYVDAKGKSHGVGDGDVPPFVRSTPEDGYYR